MLELKWKEKLAQADKEIDALRNGRKKSIDYTCGPKKHARTSSASSTSSELVNTRSSLWSEAGMAGKATASRLSQLGKDGQMTQHVASGDDRRNACTVSRPDIESLPASHENLLQQIE